MVKIKAKSNVNVKIDADVKENATMLLNRMGLDQTTAIDMFYRQIIAENRLPFQPIVLPTLDEQIVTLALKSNPRIIELETNNDGNVVLDKDLHPELYDWAANG